MNPPSHGAKKVGIEALGDYAERIDVRSAIEFADDHVPGATSHPVLDDAERARVGTLYTQSPFTARRLGAALVARNIAAMLETTFCDKQRDWRPLVYCWRGGQRSRALAHVLNEIGWRAAQLDGGYRSYRRQVVAELVVAPARHRFVVVCGLAGSGKSRLLAALADEGAQTLDLEAMAKHRGSLLGDLPGEPQPSQKRFESLLLAALRSFDPVRPVFVESESRRVGTLQVPESLLERMRAGRGLTVRTSRAQRVELLKDEYRHFLAAPETLLERLRPLTPLHGKATIARWEAFARAGDWDDLVGELLDLHYDPTYTRSLARNFPPEHKEFTIDVDAASPAGFAALAREVHTLVETAEPVVAG
jgi:tRNA 2-selenouridine synthase